MFCQMMKRKSISKSRCRLYPKERTFMRTWLTQTWAGDSGVGSTLIGRKSAVGVVNSVSRCCSSRQQQMVLLRVSGGI